MWAQGFSGIKFGINFPAGCSVQFLLYWHVLYPSTYYFTSFITPGHQKFLVTNSIVFYCPPTGVSWCSLIISTLNILSLGTYTFPSLYIMLSTSLHLSTFLLLPTSFLQWLLLLYYLSSLTVSLFPVDQLLPQ